MKKPIKKPDKLSMILTFFDEAVATKPRKKLLSVLLCGIGATLFSAGIAIGTTKTADEEKAEQNDKTE